MNIFEIYKRCIKGECTPEEAVLVERWMKDHPDAFEQEMLSEMREMGVGSPMPESVRQEMLAHFRSLGLSETGRLIGMEVMMEKDGVVPLAGRPRAVIRVDEEEIRMEGENKRRVRKMGRWAAAVAMLAVVFTGVWLYGSKKENEKPIAWALIENEGHGVRLVMLPDSSRIWLNTGAHIRYRVGDDSRESRLIELTGEAYFKVTAQVGRSFTVMAGRTRTTVLGTEFNIEAYPGEAMVRVSLQAGKVQVSSLDEKGGTKESRLLEPGQAAVFHKDSSLLAVMQTAVENPQAWIREALVLNDVSLEDAFARIGRRYGKRIVFDAGKTRGYGHIKASYNKPSIDQVLMQLGFTCDFHFKKDSNTYTISFDKDRVH